MVTSTVEDAYALTQASTTVNTCLLNFCVCSLLFEKLTFRKDGKKSTKKVPNIFFKNSVKISAENPIGG